jgi:hypothetical protein
LAPGYLGGFNSDELIHSSMSMAASAWAAFAKTADLVATGHQAM